MAQNNQEISSLSTIAILIIMAVIFLPTATKIFGPVAPLMVVAGLILVVLLIGLRVIDQYETGDCAHSGAIFGHARAGAHLDSGGHSADDQGGHAHHHGGHSVARGDHQRQRDRWASTRWFISRWNRTEKSILNIKDYTLAVAQYAQAALRDVIGGIELDPLLSEREKISEEIKKIVDTATDSWGINVTDIKIQDIELPADMKRVMAKQAESERERRAIIIRAEGEFQASARLAEAAKMLTDTPGGLSMRTLQTIEKINPDPSKTVIFALPVEIMEGFKKLTGK